MSYTPTNWQTGDIVTAELLNKMEQGIAAAADPFVVTLTPTALDYSGTMDKTVAEISNAFEAGAKIVFRLLVSGTEYMDVDCTARWRQSETYPSFNAFVVSEGNGNNVLIFAHTNTTDDGSKNTYGTSVYPLTPMS